MKIIHHYFVIGSRPTKFRRFSIIYWKKLPIWVYKNAVPTNIGK